MLTALAAAGRAPRRLLLAAPRAALHTDVTDCDTTATVPAATAAAAAAAPLQDSLGRRHDYLRISLTERCNLRCQYCMPAAGVPLSARGALLTAEETVRLAGVFAALGVRKVRLTGGEPTLRRDLPELVRRLAALPGVRTLALTTNALALARRLPELRRAGLAALNISLDSLRPDRYELMTRRPGLPRVLAAVDLALQLGFAPVKLNTVLMKGFNDDEICDFVELTRDRDLEVRFIEFMPFSGNEWSAGALVPYRAALRAVLARHPGLRALRPEPHHTARVSVAGARVRRPRRLRGLHDAALLRLLQPAAPHRRREPQGVPVRRGGGVTAGRGPRGRLGRRAGAAGARRAGQQEAQARRNGEPRPHGKSTDDPYRRVGLGAAGGLLGARRYCTFSHLDGEGRARMVDVSGKPVSARRAAAECRVLCSAALVRRLRAAALRKGDALAVAEVAGALAAKRAADLIPLCHPLPLDCARVTLALPDADDDDDGGGAVHVRCEVTVTARTGAEMEALTGAAVAALTLYDMCKSVDSGIVISDLRLVHKSGGSSDRNRDRAAPRAAPDR